MLTITEKTTRRQQRQQKQQLQKHQQLNLKQQRYQQLLLFGLAIIFGIVICGQLPTADAQPVTRGDEHSVEVETKRYCSSTLSDAIRLICGGRYNSLSRQFPDSIGHGQIHALQNLAPSEDESDSYFRPLTNGPIHECCRRPCGYSELKLYCAPDDTN